MKKESEKKMRSEKVANIVEFLNETKKDLRALKMSEERFLQLQTELEDTYDIEDDDERINEKHRLEREHSDEFDNIEYLKKVISENFSVAVAKDLVPFVNKLMQYTISIQTRLDSIAYDARELSDENELDDTFFQANEQINEQKESVN